MPKARKTPSGVAKVKRDPNAPKKPSGPYIHYCAAKRSDIKATQPELGVAQIGKILGEMWRNETEEAKQPFYDLARKDKERYNRQFAAYSISPRKPPAETTATE